MDTDGTLLNNQTLPPALLPSPATFSPGPNATLHSGVGNFIFDPSACVYFSSANGSFVDASSTTSSPRPGVATPADAVWCRPSLLFKRVTHISITPTNTAMGLPNVIVVDMVTNRSTAVPYYTTEDGHTFYAPAGRQLYVYHDTPTRVEVGKYRWVLALVQTGNGRCIKRWKIIQIILIS